MTALKPRLTVVAMGLMLGALLCCGGSAISEPGASPGPVRVLIVSGANNHDWRWTTPSLASMLEASGRFEVSVTEEPGRDLARPELLDGVAAVVLDYNGPRWGPEAEQAFLAAVDEGLGVVVVHAANNAFPGWAEYEALVGRCWREGTGHGAFHRFDVIVTDRDHPVSAHLSDLRQHPDELYHGLKVMPGATDRVLAWAHSSEASGGSGREEPMLMVSRRGKGRVVHTPLGHVWPDAEATRASHADPQFRGLILRCTEWAATGRVLEGPRLPPGSSDS